MALKLMTHQLSERPNRSDLKARASRVTTLALPLLLVACQLAPAWGAASVMVQDFEKASPAPSVWVVNIPNENASVQLATEQPHDGKQCLKLPCLKSKLQKSISCSPIQSHF